mgnify:CR=1 FL=1
MTKPFLSGGSVCRVSRHAKKQLSCNADRASNAACRRAMRRILTGAGQADLNYVSLAAQRDCFVLSQFCSSAVLQTSQQCEPMQTRCWRVSRLPDCDEVHLNSSWSKSNSYRWVISYPSLFLVCQLLSFARSGLNCAMLGNVSVRVSKVAAVKQPSERLQKALAPTGISIRQLSVLHVVGTPIGHPDDISIRALRILDQARLIAGTFCLPQ